MPVGGALNIYKSLSEHSTVQANGKVAMRCRKAPPAPSLQQNYLRLTVWLALFGESHQ